MGMNGWGWMEADGWSGRGGWALGGGQWVGMERQGRLDRDGWGWMGMGEWMRIEWDGSWWVDGYQVGLHAWGLGGTGSLLPCPVTTQFSPPFLSNAVKLSLKSCNLRQRRGQWPSRFLLPSPARVNRMARVFYWITPHTAAIHKIPKPVLLLLVENVFSYHSYKCVALKNNIVYCKP